MRSATIPTIKGASLSAFHTHSGYRRLLAPQRPAVGVFLPARFHEGDMCALAEYAERVEFGLAGRGDKAAAVMRGHRQRRAASEIFARCRLLACSAKLEVLRSISDAIDADAFKLAQ